MQGNSKNEETMLDVFTLQLIEHGAKILQKRFEFLHLLQEWAAPIHRGISRGLEELEIVYKPSVDVSESMDLSKIKEVYYESFQSVKQREIFRGTTLIEFLIVTIYNSSLIVKCSSLWFARTTTNDRTIPKIS